MHGFVDIINCYNTGTITAKGGNPGGISGNNAKNIVNCHNSGPVIAETSCNADGIGVGRNIINCYNDALVSSLGNAYGIGFVNGGTIINTFNIGELKAKQVEGIGVGSQIKNCYNSGLLSGTKNIFAMTSSSSTTITNCYYLECDNNIDKDAGAQSMNEADMKSNTFVTKLNDNLGSIDKIENFDFYQWKYVPNSYPQFDVAN